MISLRERKETNQGGFVQNQCTLHKTRDLKFYPTLLHWRAVLIDWHIVLCSYHRKGNPGSGFQTCLVEDAVSLAVKVPLVLSLCCLWRFPWWQASCLLPLQMWRLRCKVVSFWCDYKYVEWSYKCYVFLPEAIFVRLYYTYLDMCKTCKQIILSWENPIISGMF